MTTQNTRALDCTGLVKTFGGVTVVKSVDFRVPAGHVVGLIGENGAGKSTLSSMIAGIHQPDGGSMTLDGEDYAPGSPSEALNQGVALIHQEIRMVPHLSVAENIFLGRLPMKGGRVDRASMYEQTAAVLGTLGVDIDPRRSVLGLSTAQQQSIEIAKSILRDPRYVKVMHDAMKYRELQSRKPDVDKKVAKAASPNLKPSGKQSQKQTDMREMKQTLKKSGHLRDAQRIVEQML